MNSNLRSLWDAAGGNAPEHWEFKTIEELLEHSKSISVGVMYPGSHINNGVPLVRVSNVKNGEIGKRPEFCIGDQVDEEYKRTRLNGTELLITLVGNPGDCVVVTKEMVGWNVARALAVVKLADVELRSWLRYVLLSKPAKHLIEARLNTTVQKTLNLKDIRELGIPIAPKIEREVITKTINALERKILINTQTNQTLEAIAQAIFKSWFVDFEPVKAKMAVLEAGGTAEEAERAAMCAISGKDEAALTQLQTEQSEAYAELTQTAALFPSSMQDSELGEIPEGWKIGSVGDIARAKGGYAFKSNQFIETGNPVVKIKNITGSGTVDISDCQCVSDKDAKSAERFQLFDGDLVMAMTGATVGKIGLMNTHGRSAYLNQRVAKFESDTFGPEVSYFLFCVFNRPEVFDVIVGTAQGSAQPNISSSLIEAAPLVIPSARLLKQIINSVQPLFYRWLKNNDESLTLALSRDNLLPKLLSCEITLDEIGVK